MLTLFLSKIKLQHILIIALIAMAVTISMLWNEVTFQKSESLRKGENYKSMRDIDSLKTVNFTFRTETEMSDYINSNRGLKELMEKQKDEYNGKIKKLTNIIYQKNKYIDEIEKSTDVSEIVDDIRNDIPAFKEWVDSTKCLVVKGRITYKSNVLQNVVTERRFENEMVLTGHLQRSQRNWWTRTFGRRKESIVTVTSNCGETKTIIIDKVKKK